jgi:hypothetical protein
MKNVAALFVLLCHYQSFSILIMPDTKWKAILSGVKRLTNEAAKNGCGNHLIVTSTLIAGQTSLTRATSPRDTQFDF